MNTEAFAFDFKFRQAMLCKEREEIAQLVHGKLLVRPARLVLLMAASTSTITLPAAACGVLRLFG